MDININYVNSPSYQRSKDLLNKHGQWNVDLLKNLFPQNLVTKILVILPPGINVS